MKVLSLLFLVAVGVTAIRQPNSCTPSPPKNVEILDTTSSVIYVSFEDPDDLDRCPILLYRTRCVEDKSEITFDFGGNKLHQANFTDLKAATAYAITCTSVSPNFVESTPVVLHTSTKSAP